MDHWSIEVIAEKDRVNSDLGNDTRGQPTGNNAKDLQEWINWANGSPKPKAWVRTFEHSGANTSPKIGSSTSKPLSISEENAVEAIKLVRELKDKTDQKL